MSCCCREACTRNVNTISSSTIVRLLESIDYVLHCLIFDQHCNEKSYNESTLEAMKVDSQNQSPWITFDPRIIFTMMCRFLSTDLYSAASFPKGPWHIAYASTCGKCAKVKPNYYMSFCLSIIIRLMDFVFFFDRMSP